MPSLIVILCLGQCESWLCSAQECSEVVQCQGSDLALVCAEHAFSPHSLGYFWVFGFSIFLSLLKIHYGSGKVLVVVLPWLPSARRRACLEHVSAHQRPLFPIPAPLLQAWIKDKSPHSGENKAQTYVQRRNSLADGLTVELVINCYAVCSIKTFFLSRGLSQPPNPAAGQT